MKVKTSTGWVLDTEGGWAKDATEYAHKNGLKDIIVVLGESPEGHKEYIILKKNEKGDGNEPIYSSQQYDAVCVQIDVLAMLRKG